jgi:hypothetical protein
LNKRVGDPIRPHDSEAKWSRHGERIDLEISRIKISCAEKLSDREPKL